MTHPSELIGAYLDGELSPSERMELLGHLSGCGKCSAEMDDIQRVRAAVRSLPLLELPDDILPGVDASPDVVPLHRNRGVWVGAAAAAAALIIAVAALLTPPPSTVSVDELSSRFGARVSLDPAFGPAKVVVPELTGLSE